MKVTQIIHDAIENAVNAKAQEKIDQLLEQRKPLQDAIDALDSSLDFNVKRAITEWILNVTTNNPELLLTDDNYRRRNDPISFVALKARLNSDFTITPQSYDFKFTTAAIKKINAEIDAIKTKAAKEINSIILELELGSKNKSEVQNLLDKVKF